MPFQWTLLAFFYLLPHFPREFAPHTFFVVFHRPAWALAHFSIEIRSTDVGIVSAFIVISLLSACFLRPVDSLPTTTLQFP